MNLSFLSSFPLKEPVSHGIYPRTSLLWLCMATSHSKTMLRKVTYVKMQHAFFSQDPYLGPYVQVIEGDMKKGKLLSPSFSRGSPVQTFAESLEIPCLLPGLSHGTVVLFQVKKKVLLF